MSEWKYDGEPLGSFGAVDEERVVFAVLCVDDTDDATKETSTGFIAQCIAKEAARLGGTVQLGITRHQLLLREDVPYTSHNSAMAFGLWIDCNRLDAFYDAAVEVVKKRRAQTSDPGVCLAVPPDDANACAELIAFGRRAKAEFCSKESAYGLARRHSWIRLGEYGGNGAGVVGALAGAGLRLDGNDGRFRGKWDLRKYADETPLSAGALAQSLSRKLNGSALVVDGEGRVLPAEMPVFPEPEAKPVLLHGSLTLVCDVVDGAARPLEKVDLGSVGDVDGSWSRVCDAFSWDNDEEECLDGVPSCKNCLHRRWVKRGFMCVRGASAKLA